MLEVGTDVLDIIVNDSTNRLAIVDEGNTDMLVVRTKGISNY